MHVSDCQSSLLLEKTVDERLNSFCIPLFSEKSKTVSVVSSFGSLGFVVYSCWSTVMFAYLEQEIKTLVGNFFFLLKVSPLDLKLE